jgi:hypothetical protein
MEAAARKKVNADFGQRLTTIRARPRTQQVQWMRWELRQAVGVDAGDGNWGKR